MAKGAGQTSAPSPKQLSTLDAPNAGSSKDIRPDVEVPEDLGKLIRRDAELVKSMGWEALVRQRRGRGDMTDMRGFQHPAKRLLRLYGRRGVPVKLRDKAWTRKQIEEAIRRGPHGSCAAHREFLHGEFANMINLNQWLVLPYSVVKHLKNLHVSPPGVVPQRNRRPRWICDYTWSGINDSTLPLVPWDSLQYGRALERYLRHILLADPAWGPVHMLKCDLSDGYYRLGVIPEDAPRLGMDFPGTFEGEPLIAIPLVLPMGWTNSGPAFCAATET